MARTDLNEVLMYSESFSRAARATGMPKAVLQAIASRESR